MTRAEICASVNSSPQAGMSLPWTEALTARLMPAGVYYARRLSDEQAWGEHELYLLGEIVRPGGTAVDVGANQGVFSYAFSRIAERVSPP